MNAAVSIDALADSIVATAALSSPCFAVALKCGAAFAYITCSTGLLCRVASHRTVILLFSAELDTQSTLVDSPFLFSVFFFFFYLSCFLKSTEILIFVFIARKLLFFFL